MKQSRRHIDINLNELDQVLDHARAGPLSQNDYEKLRMALHTLAELLALRRSTEKTSAVVGHPDASAAHRRRQRRWAKSLGMDAIPPLRLREPVRWRLHMDG
jgi:hypothetical protein